MSLSLDLMSNIKENVLKLHREISNHNVTIVAVSKTYSLREVRELYDQGITNFGENRVEELLSKKEQLSDLRINWHFVGNLQSNKVKKVINSIDFLHSLDRLSVAKEINKYRDQPLRCFIQVNISQEESKSGIKLSELPSFINSLKKYDKILVVGFMTMGVINDLVKTEEVFKQLTKLTETIPYKELSMGMSDDYQLAIKHGATFIRIGRMLVR